MKRTAFILATIWAAFGYAQAADYAPVPKQLLHCTAPAFQGDDNDIRIRPEDRQRGRPVALPQAVATSMDTATDWVTRPSRDLALWKSEAGSQADLDAMKCRDVYPLVNVVTLRDGMQLYVAHAESFAAEWALLIVYDPATGKATPKPAYISTKWASPKDPYLHRPYIATADLRGDGHWQLVVEEQAHNGNVYNAAVYRYFDIAPDLALTNVLALETRSWMPEDEGAMLLRKLTRIDAHYQRIDVAYARSATDKTPKSWGYAIVESAGTGIPYHVVERHGVSGRLSRLFDKSTGILITMSWYNDDEFLKEGHGLYY